MKGLFRAAIAVSFALLTVSAAPNWLNTYSKTATGYRLGNPDAPVKLIAFESYTCHFCADFENKASPELKLAYVEPGKVSVEVRHYVRDPVDLTAAMLSECVAPAKFFATHRAFFLAFDKYSPIMFKASQPKLDLWYGKSGDRAAGRRAAASDLGFYDIVAAQGLTRAQADKCLNNEAAATRLAQQTKADDEKYNISGTPSFALNGLPLFATHDWSLLRPQIDARLP